MLRCASMFAAATLALLASTPAQAAPLNPWGVHVGEGVFALTPFLYVDQAPTLYPYVYGQYGFTSKFELLAGVGATALPGFSFSSVEVMPRFFFTDSTGVALHATYVPGDDGVTLAPEYHGIYEIGPLTLTANAGWAPTLGGSGFSAGKVFAKVAPEYFFNEATSVFVEVNPSYDLADYGGMDVDRFYLELVPGVGTAVGGRHFFAFGAGIPITGFDPSGIYGGMWYSIAFGGA